MIDQLASLGKVNSIGRDGFLWWIGQIAHKDSWRGVNANIRNSGSKPARVKVRIVGYHPFDDEGNILPDDDLPWAEVLADPFTGSGQGGISETLNLVGGEMVLGFFLDGEDAQQPVVMGLFHKYDNIKNTFKASEMSSRKSSGFKAYEAYSKSSSTSSEQPQNHQIQSSSSGDKSNIKKIVSPAVSNDKDEERQLKPGSNVAGETLENKATTVTKASTPCDENSIGKITQVTTDFIEMIQGLENAGDAWIDPITNTVVDMQAELAFIKGQVAGVMRGTLNEIKTSMMKKVNKKFKKLLGDFKKDNTDRFFKEKGLKKSLSGISTLINCAFGAALAKAGDFILNMFKNLLGKAFNAAICAIEQFTAGIFSKLFDTLEKSLGTIMSGLNWLVGGFSSFTNILRGAGSMARKLLDIIGKCDVEPCAKPTDFASNLGSKLSPPSNYKSLLDKANVLSGVSKSLTKAGRGGGIRTGINNFFGTSTDPIENTMNELTIFKPEDSLFEDCNRRTLNPTSQSDIVPRRPGFIYPKCLPPDYQVIGSGSGASLLVVVGNSRRIFSVEVLDGGSGYGTDTRITIIDNTGNGSGAHVKPIIQNGSIVDVVVLSAGFGYCLNTTAPETPEDSDSVININAGVGTDVIGTVKGVYVSRPGAGYDPEDTVTFEGVEDGTNIPIITTTSGSIAGVNFPPNVSTEFRVPPVLTVNSAEGIGVELIPIMSFKPQFTTDTGAEERRAKPLIGIPSVIDCIGTNTQVVGYVNGVAYSGPYHVMSNGLKMTGATHSETDSIIYDTIQESLGQRPIVTQVYTTQETTTTETVETPVDTTPIIVTNPVTPTTPTTTTDTTTSTDSSTSSEGGSTSSGGGGYGGY